MSTLKKNVVVGIADLRVSNDTLVVLATNALGSCIGVAAYDRAARVGGLLHYQLPASEIDPERARENPAMFADTGMTALLSQMAALGADKRRLKIKLAGGARMLASADMFDIGNRNHTAIRKILWQRGFLIEAEQTGGTVARDLFLRIADGFAHVVTHGLNATSREFDYAL